MRKNRLMIVGLSTVMLVLAGCKPAAAPPGNEVKPQEEAAVPAAGEQEETAKTQEEPDIEDDEEPAIEDRDEPAEIQEEADIEDREEADIENREEAAEEDDRPCYTMSVNWTKLEFFDVLEYMAPEQNLVVDVSSGSSEVDPASVRMEQPSYEVYYAKVNGTEVPVYTREVLEDGYDVEFLRDDIKYTISWETFQNSLETDCKAELTDRDGNIHTITREEGLYRSYTGAWYFGIGTINNGQLEEFEPY